MIREILIGLAIWTAVGVLAFNLFVVFVFRTGIVYTARHRDGRLKERLPLSGVITSASLLLLSIAVLILFDYCSLRNLPEPLSFGQLFWLNLTLYGILFLYDAFVIDVLVLVKWRPSFLGIPDEMNAESMGEHVRESLVRGGIIVGLIALVSTGIAFVAFMG